MIHYLVREIFFIVITFHRDYRANIPLSLLSCEMRMFEKENQIENKIERMVFLNHLRKKPVLSQYTFAVSVRANYLCFISIFFPKTLKQTDSNQTALLWKLSLRFFFVLNSYNLTALLRQTISAQPFYIDLKRANKIINIYLFVPIIAAAY